jgi:hypothetical protein
MSKSCYVGGIRELEWIIAVMFKHLSVSCHFSVDDLLPYDE